MSYDLIRITLAQLNPTVGDIDGNAQQILNIWKKYDTTSDLVIFPELFLCGYPPEDLILNSAFIDYLEQKLEHIRTQSKNYNSSALIPTIWRKNSKIYNAALIVKSGKIIDIILKHKLPNNFVFDEPRTFASGPLPMPVSFHGHKLGIMICEDLWHSDVSLHLKNNGAEFLIAINGSPFHSHQFDKRKSVAIKAVSETSLDLIYLNMFGGQDELVFDGRSFIMSKDQKISYIAPAFEKSIIQTKVSRNPKSIDVIDNINIVNKQCNEQELIYKALVTGVKDYVHKNGFSDVLIGLSGGIDSALTATIAVDALGKDHVRCIMLPSEFTSQESLDDAKECAKLLGVKYEIIKIEQAISTFENIIPNLNGLAHENTQSRIRGTILMALSNISGEMLLTTGNKSEMAVGYCTLYGDMNGGFNPLKDVYKTQVYELSKWLNKDKDKDIIPQRIITKEPTAELRKNQKDQDSLPPYYLLDDILRLLIEYDNVDWECASEILHDIQNKCLKYPYEVEKVARLLRNTEYKRYQSPPGTRISYRAFGRDRRYPLTNRFINKIEKSY